MFRIVTENTFTNTLDVVDAVLTDWKVYSRNLTIAKMNHIIIPITSDNEMFVAAFDTVDGMAPEQLTDEALSWIRHPSMVSMGYPVNVQQQTPESKEQDKAAAPLFN